MRAIWKLSIEDYLEIVELGKELGVKAGESLEPILLAYMKIKERKPEGMTELNKNELLAELASGNKKILDISVDTQGHTEYKVIKSPNIDN
jgi:hypothetical protein